jgi:uroporphyrinogen decarboxylase
MSAPNSIFVRACKGLPTGSTSVWFMRQAGRYMSEYREVRKHHALVEICKKPALAGKWRSCACTRLWRSRMR